MDYFYVGSGHMNSGLLDIYLPISYKKNKFSAELIPHMFQATADIADPNSAGSFLDQNLGTEIDLTLGYIVNKNVIFKCGYSQMLNSETLNYLKGVATPDNMNSWAWAMFVFKPTFFVK